MSLSFSANLGFLWAELPLPDAVRAAKRAGFTAVELHWPYATDAMEMKQALAETGLPVLGLNTSRGNLENGDFGLSALPGREQDARAAIDQALAYAEEIGASAVHVMAGKTDAPEARETFIANLRYAADKAAPSGVAILIEPINQHDAPGYFLSDNATASAIIANPAALTFASCSTAIMSAAREDRCWKSSRPTGTISAMSSSPPFRTAVSRIQAKSILPASCPGWPRAATQATSARNTSPAAQRKPGLAGWPPGAEAARLI